MKLLIALLAVAAIVGIASSVPTDEDNAYLDGLYDGYLFGHAAMAGQSDPKYEAFYNSRVVDLNKWMDEIGYTGGHWVPLQHQNYTLPVGLAWEGWDKLG